MGDTADRRETQKRDEIDPELIALKRTRPGIGPLMALSVLGLCAYLMITLRADLTYALGGKAPRDAGEAATALSASALGHNDYVTVRAVPDRTAPGWLRGRQAIGHRVLPALGTGGKLWLHVTDDVTSGPPAYDERYTGRIRRLDDLAFAAELRAWVTSLPPQPRIVDRASLGQGATARDVHGDALAPGPESSIELDVRIPGVAVVTVYQTEQLADRAAAEAALAAAAGAAISLASSTEASWTFNVPAPEGRAALEAKLAAAKLAPPFVVAEDQLGRTQGQWADLDRLLGAVAAEDVVRLIVFTRPTLPADTLVLLVDDAPGAYWYVPPLYGLLAVFTALMIWALVRALRPEKPPVLPAPAEAS